MGLAKRIAKTNAERKLSQQDVPDAPSGESYPPLPKYVCKSARKGHKRAVSDTAVLLQRDLYQVINPIQVPEVPAPEPPPTPVQPDLGYPSPDSDNQSWFDYVRSGKFVCPQKTTLDQENAHILLAETAIYCKHQPRKSPIKLQLPPEGVIKVMSAEHILLMLLSMFENPHAMKAYEALKLLRDRGDPLAKKFFQDGTVKAPAWTPPKKELILKTPSKPK